MFSNEALYVVLQISNIFEKNKKLFIIVYLYISSFFQKMYPIFNKKFLRFCVTANFFMCNYWGGGKVRRKETKINNFPAKNLQKVPPFIPFKKAHYKKDKAFLALYLKSESTSVNEKFDGKSEKIYLPLYALFVDQNKSI